MAKKKYKEMNVDEKFIYDAVSMKKLRIFYSAGVLAMGFWMILMPEGLEHANREKGTVWILKELWSPYLAVVLLLVGAYLMVTAINTLKVMSGFTWVKQVGVHYIYDNKERIFGLKSMANGTNKVVFNSAQSEVYEFENYTKIGLNKYKKVKITDEFNCNDTYWNADSSGYSMVHKGKYVENMSSEYKGDDLIVTAGDLRKKFLLKNYKSNSDDRVRKANRY